MRQTDFEERDSDDCGRNKGDINSRNDKEEERVDTFGSDKSGTLSQSKRGPLITEVPEIEKIDEIYEMQKNLGEGTFGYVRQALHKPTNELVAVKVSLVQIF